MLDKTRGLTADCVAYDLEDSVTMDMKPNARENIRRFLDQDPAAGIKEHAVRINAVGSGLEADDLEHVVRLIVLSSSCGSHSPITGQCAKPQRHRHPKSQRGITSHLGRRFHTAQAYCSKIT